MTLPETMTMKRRSTGLRLRSLMGGALSILIASCAGNSQRLAQRNWQNSGLTVQTWWNRATFCDVDLRQDRAGGVKAVTARLDELQAAGCEAIVLDLLSEAQGTSATSLAFGTLDDADELIGQSGRRKMRLIFVLPLHPRGDAAARQATLDRMRFWLARGIAGFVLKDQDNSTPAETAALAHQAHLAAASALGTRVLISDGLPTMNDVLTQTAGARRSAVEDVPMALRALPVFGRTAAVHDLRGALAGAVGKAPVPLLALEQANAADGPRDPQAELAAVRARAAILLGHGAAALIPPGVLAGTATRRTDDAPRDTSISAEATSLFVPLGGDATGIPPREQLAGWLRSLTELRHTSAALRTGVPVYLDRDAQGVLAWVLRPKGPGPALLFVCNLSGHPVHVALAADLRTLGVPGDLLRSVLTTEPETPTPALDSIDLGIDGVLAGEIR